MLMTHYERKVLNELVSWDKDFHSVDMELELLLPVELKIERFPSPELGYHRLQSPYGNGAGC